MESGETQKVSTAPEQRIFISRSELGAMGIRLSNPTLLRLEAAKRFPRRVRISAGKVCWPLDEILGWIQKKKEERTRHRYADCE